MLRSKTKFKSHFKKIKINKKLRAWWTKMVVLFYLVTWMQNNKHDKIPLNFWFTHRNKHSLIQREVSTFFLSFWKNSAKLLPFSFLKDGLVLCLTEHNSYDLSQSKILRRKKSCWSSFFFRRFTAHNFLSLFYFIYSFFK